MRDKGPGLFCGRRTDLPEDFGFAARLAGLIKKPGGNAAFSIQPLAWMPS
jgi:hypothetical protein